MTRWRAGFVWRIAIAIAVSGVAVLADEWRLPSRERDYSANRQYRVDVTPRSLESQLAYFSDKVDGKAPTGSAPGAATQRPMARLYVKRTVGHRQLSSFPLLNDVSPVDVLVSNDGRYVVTTDDWHTMGYGPHTVVIYRGDGTVVRAFALADLVSEHDIASLPHSTSSIGWATRREIDDLRQQVVLTIDRARP